MEAATPAASAFSNFSEVAPFETLIRKRHA